MSKSKFNSYYQRFKSQQDRFAESVLINHISGCWVWTGYTTNRGYGLFHMNGRSVRAHRASWELYAGPIPKNKLICHKCDNPGCVNPEHLYIGTPASNMRDKCERGRQSRLLGELHPFAKLNERDVREIRASSGTCKEVGAKYGVRPMQVSRIRRGLRWGHVT